MNFDSALGPMPAIHRWSQRIWPKIVFPVEHRNALPRDELEINAVSRSRANRPLFRDLQPFRVFVAEIPDDMILVPLLNVHRAGH